MIAFVPFDSIWKFVRNLGIGEISSMLFACYVGCAQAFHTFIQMFILLAYEFLLMMLT